MEEKNKSKNKTSSYEQEIIETSKKISEYKLAAEANVVAILYKNPEEFYNINITIDDFSNNAWKVYYKIASEIILKEKKCVLDDLTVGFYLEKHEKLKKKYEEYGGYNTIESAKDYVDVENLSGYIEEMKKWKSVLALCKNGYPVKDELDRYVDMSEEDIYSEYETFINHVFSNSAFEIKSYNVFENIEKFIEELNEGSEIGIPFYNAPLLTEEIGGFNLNGHIYGLGASSGVGKTTMVFNYLVPSAIKRNQKIVMVINEEDERKIRKELIIWVANNILKKELHKRDLRNGHFNCDILNILKECAKWIDERKEEQFLTVIPLERYSVNTVVKIIKKYSSMGVRIFILDTLKESCDAKTDEIHKSMMRDMITLYDVIKPSAKNVGLFVTYQLGKGSLKMRHLTNNEIGQSKSIIDVMSVNLMMRRPYEDEYDGGSKELKCYKLEGANRQTEIQFKLKKSENHMITFITKNRFGETDRKQIVSKCDLSTNKCEDVGYCIVPQDW